MTWGALDRMPIAHGLQSDWIPQVAGNRMYSPNQAHRRSRAGNSSNRHASGRYSLLTTPRLSKGSQVTSSTTTRRKVGRWIGTQLSRPSVADEAATFVRGTWEIASLVQQFHDNHSSLAGIYILLGAITVHIESQDDTQLSACIASALVLHTNTLPPLPGGCFSPKMGRLSVKVPASQKLPRRKHAALVT